MKIFLHDYGRYAFTLDLARELARRGHTVAYCYSDLDSVRADMQQSDPNLTLVPVRGADSLVKDSFVQRYKAEVGHGEKAGREISRFRPDVILSGNAPLEAQYRMLAASKGCDAKFVYWMQDILSIAARRILPKKLPVLGTLVADHFERIEKKMALDSDAIVVIADAFKDTLEGWRVDPAKITVIENWAPQLGQADPDKVEEWKEAHALSGKRIILYSGTLGMKHKPELLLRLSEELASNEDVRIVIIAEGPGMDWLKAQIDPAKHGNMLLLPFQPFSMLPVTLAASDLLLVLLEPEAGAFCVPSKTLTYMLAGRPILGGMPLSNLASQLIVRHDMGVVSPPDDVQGFAKEGMGLITDTSRAKEMGAHAKAYADETFDLTKIATRFEDLFKSVAAKP